jgi:hypothetical protein
MTNPLAYCRLSFVFREMWAAETQLCNGSFIFKVKHYGKEETSFCVRVFGSLPNYLKDY